MAPRIANLIVLAEDKEQQNLVRRYLERSGQDTRTLRLVPLPASASGGSGEKYVRDNYAEQVLACRSALGRGASALLVVVVDADTKTTQQRSAQLAAELEAAGLEERSENDRIAVLIPKRHVETWIPALLGKRVNEVTNYTKPPYRPPASTDVRNAATELYKWTRPAVDPPATFPPFLTSSIPQWRKVPSR